MFALIKISAYNNHLYDKFMSKKYWRKQTFHTVIYFKLLIYSEFHILLTSTRVVDLMTYVAELLLARYVAINLTCIITLNLSAPLPNAQHPVWVLKVHENDHINCFSVFSGCDTLEKPHCSTPVSDKYNQNLLPFTGNDSCEWKILEWEKLSTNEHIKSVSAGDINSLYVNKSNYKMQILM